MRNRQNLITVAQAVFATEGLNAPMDRITSRAGVGPGTLYRHFPNRAQLWEAVLEEPLSAQLQLAQRALDNPDRWAGLSGYIVASCALEAEHNGYLNLMTTRFDGAPRLLVLRSKIQQVLKDLVHAARAEGAVRQDFTTEDLIFISLSNSKVAEVTRSTAPDAWRRNVELFLEAIRPDHARPLSQRPMTPSEVYRTMFQAAPAPTRPGRQASAPRR